MGSEMCIRDRRASGARRAPASCALPTLDGVRALEPVFFCALEAESASEHGALDAALSCLALEDPSLHVRAARETGQLLLAGMGELHLEIAVHRLRRDFGVDVRVGRMLVAYRETCCATRAVEHAARSERAFAGKPWPIDVELTITGESDDAAHAYRAATAATAAGAADGGVGGGVAAGGGGALVRVAPELDDQLRRAEREALLGGLEDGLLSGPLAGFPSMGVSAELVRARFDAGTPPLALRLAASEAAAAAYARASPALLEPVMTAEIIAPESHVGAVLADLSAHRRAAVLAVTVDEGRGPQLALQRVRALVPLAQLVGYSTALRSLTHGEGDLSLEFAHYARLDGASEKAILVDARGY